MRLYDDNRLQAVWVADQGDGSYINPVLYTDYSMQIFTGFKLKKPSKPG